MVEQEQVQINIVPFSVPPPVLPLHIPIHPSLNKGFTWKDISALLDEGTLPSAVHDEVLHDK
jgi:hypothetical protein